MTATALILEVPEAEPVVSRWRALYDPSAAAGMPAHVTLVFPFKQFDRIDGSVETTLTKIFSATTPLDFRFGSTGRFPGVLWLAPHDPARVVTLIQALVAAFPDCRPYGGAYEEIVPHLTVADLHRDQDGEKAIDGIARQFEEEAAAELPIGARVEAASLFHNEAGMWRLVRRFAFQ